MKQHKYILTILWLGLLSSPLLFAADKCPQDSIIGRSENGTCVSKTLYQYDDAGRTLVSETWKINADSVLIGQTKTTNEYYENGKTKSTATWIWSTTTNDWKGKERQDYTYDDQGNTTSWSIYSWSDVTNDWTNKNKYVYEYENKKQTLAITYTGSGDQWIPKTKSELKYDAQGHTILDRYYGSYDASNDKWIGEHWYINSYTGNQLTLSEKYSWMDDDWYGTSKVEYGYNAAGKQTYYIYYTWDATQKVFICTSKQITDYDQWQNIIYSEQYKMEDSKWVGVTKARAEYTSYNSDPIMTATFQWDATKGIFIGVDSIRIAKDAAGNQILDEQYNWQNNNWAGIKKEETIYDEANNKISIITYSWQKESASWMYDTRDSASYNENKLKVLEEKYKWNTADGGYWEGTGEKSVSEYTNNMQTLKEVYIWKSEIKDWTYKTKIKKEYAGTTLILDEEYELQADGQFKGTKKERYIVEGKKKTTIDYSWLYEEIWQGKDSIIANYDGSGNQTEDEQYQWAGEYWKGVTKGNYTYNKNKKVLTSHEWAWDDFAHSWVDSVKTEAKYDTWKNLIYDERYTYDVAHSQWIGTLKKEYQYNDKGEQTMFANYTWTETKFIGTQKEEKALDDDGRVIMQAKYDWGTNDWKGKSKDSTTYFRNDTVAEKIAFSWQTNKWVESKKTKDTYSDAGLHTATANYTWSGGWVGVKQTTWTYVAPGKVDTAIVSKWNSGNWENDTRRVNTYTDGNVTSYVDYQWENSDWVNVARWEQEDKNTEYSYEWLNSDWVRTQENKKTYDDQNRLILETKRNWSGGELQGGSKTVYVYTGDKMTLQTDSAYLGGQWTLTQRITNTYTDGKQTLAMKETFTNGTQTGGSKTTKTFDDGQLTNETKFIWNDGWKYVSKTDNVYNGKTTITTNYTSSNGTTWQGVDSLINEFGDGSDVVITKFVWRNNDWVGDSKTGYTYYESGKEKSVITYSWVAEMWIEDKMTEYEYSGIRNKVTAISHKEGTKWVGDSKTGVYYDEGENETSASWTWTDSGWKPASKSGITLYDNGKTKSQTTYKILGDDFVYNTRTTYVYGTGDKDITKAIYNWNGTAWIGASKKGEVWEGGKQTQVITYAWVSGTNWKNDQKTEYEYGAYPSTAIFVWDESHPGWKGVSKSGETYDGDKITSKLLFVWDSIGWQWVNDKMTEYTYGTGNNKITAYYIGKGTEWIGISKYEEYYTEKGDSLNFYTKCWKDGDWADSLKQEYTYNDHGDIILFIDAHRNGSTWENNETSTKREISYNAEDSIILDANYIWYDGDWAPMGIRIERRYDSQSNLIYFEKKQPSGYKWVGSTKQEWKYDSYDNIIMYSYMYYDTTRKKYGSTNSTKYEKEYSENGLEVMSATYRFNVNVKVWDWEGISKTTKQFDNNGVVVEDVSYQWSSTDKKWIEQSKHEYTRDNKGQILEQIDYRYSQTTGWYLTKKTINEYDISHGKIATFIYEYSDGDWRPLSFIQKIYDDYPEYKQRTDLYAIWLNGTIQTYELKSTYYACDPVITLIASPEEGGKVSGGGANAVGAEINISATPNDCYTFDHWEDEDGNTDTNNPKKVIVTEDKTYTAIFSPVKHTIRASVKLDSDGTATGGSVRVTLKPKK